MQCTECQKEFYREISLEEPCEDCHRKFMEKVSKRVEEMVEKGYPEGGYTRTIAIIDILEEEVREEIKEEKWN